MGVPASAFISIVSIYRTVFEINFELLAKIPCKMYSDYIEDAGRIPSAHRVVGKLRRLDVRLHCQSDQ